MRMENTKVAHYLGHYWPEKNVFLVKSYQITVVLFKLDDEEENHSLFFLITCAPLTSLLPLLPFLPFFPQSYTRLYNSPVSLSTVPTISHVIILVSHLDRITVQNIRCPSLGWKFMPQPTGIRNGHMTCSGRLYSEQQSWSYTTFCVSVLICMFKAFVLEKLFSFEAIKGKGFCLKIAKIVINYRKKHNFKHTQKYIYLKLKQLWSQIKINVVPWFAAYVKKLILNKKKETVKTGPRSCWI